MAEFHVIDIEQLTEMKLRAYIQRKELKDTQDLAYLYSKLGKWPEEVQKNKKYNNAILKFEEDRKRMNLSV